MRPIFKVLLTWALSPVGTLLNTGLLAVVLFLAGGAPHRAAFWLPLAIFLGVSGFYDVSAYVAQRRKGLTSEEVANAVFERIWPSRKAEEDPR
jgi:hypothetical protein